MGYEKHLIQEIKDQLDQAVGAVNATEQTVMDLESAYNQLIADKDTSQVDLTALMAEKESKQDQLDLGAAYTLQKKAAGRFAMVSRVYEIAATETDQVKLAKSLAAYLFRANDDTRTISGADTAISQLSAGLLGYFRYSNEESYDQKIRDSWIDIEQALQKLGRGEQ